MRIYTFAHAIVAHAHNSNHAFSELETPLTKSCLRPCYAPVQPPYSKFPRSAPVYTLATSTFARNIQSTNSMTLRSNYIHNFCSVSNGRFIATPFRSWSFKEIDYFSTKVCDLGLHFGAKSSCSRFCKRVR